MPRVLSSSSTRHSVTKRMTIHPLVRCSRVSLVLVVVNMVAVLVQMSRLLPGPENRMIATALDVETAVTSAAANGVTAPAAPMVLRPTHRVHLGQSRATRAIVTALSRACASRVPAQAIPVIRTAHAAPYRSHPCPPMPGPLLRTSNSRSVELVRSCETTLPDGRAREGCGQFPNLPSPRSFDSL